MKKIVLAMGVSVLALAAPASAKDGFYMGLGLTSNANENEVEDAATQVGGGSPQLTAAGNRAAIAASAARDLSTDPYGAFLMVGYGFDIDDKIVAGIEVDASVFDGETASTATTPYPTQNAAPGTETFTVSHALNQQWISTVRAKLGFKVTPDAALFVTAGAAFTDAELQTRFSDNWPAPNTIVSQGVINSDIKTGVVYGGGLNWAIGGSTALRIEYLRHDFGKVATTRALSFTNAAVPPGVAANEVLDSKAQLNTNTLRVGLAWDLNL